MMVESEYKAREREQTVQKYIGGASRAEVLPGEEGPANQEHVDYYGFIYESAVPASVLDKQLRIRQRDLKREKKWEKLLVTRDQRPGRAGDLPASARVYGNSERRLDEHLVHSKKGTNEKLIRRVYKGIPTKLRSLVWADLLRYRGMVVDRETYQQMVLRAHKYSPDIHQIDLDVNRTYRNTTFFRERYGPRQRQLFNVLAAYSMYNTDVGYCQGMSEIAAFLLMHLNEEAEVFWALHTLFTHRHWQMHGFFIKGFPKLTRYFDHHDRLLSKHLPRVYKHLKKLDIHPSCYAFKWYMQCFIGLPYTLTLRLWDIFLVIGERLLIFMSFNIMKILRGSVLKMDQSEVLVFMHEPLRNRLAELDDDKLIESLKDAVNELRYDWRPPQDLHTAEQEGPPPDSHFGRPLPPDYLQLAQERQVDQSDVEATLRRSLRRSSPRLPEPSSPDEPPPSPYDNTPPVQPFAAAAPVAPVASVVAQAPVGGVASVGPAAAVLVSVTPDRPDAGKRPRVEPTPKAAGGGSNGAGPVKSHSLPEDVALAMQMEVLAGVGGAPKRAVRSQASSPLDDGAVIVMRPPNYETTL